MNKPCKPSPKTIPDYRLFEMNEDCKEKGGCEKCKENNTCSKEGLYYDIDYIPLYDLIQAYKDCNLKDVIIRAYQSYGNRATLAIELPETDEAFQERLKKYEANMAEWEAWKNRPKKSLKDKEDNKKRKLKEKIKKLEELLGKLE